MTLPALEIAQAAADLIGIAIPTSLLNSSEGTTRALLAAMNQGGPDIARMRGAFYQSWTFLTRGYEFTTVDGQIDYPLPADYEALIEDTAWDSSSHYPARGPLSPSAWQRVKQSLVGSIDFVPRYRIRADASGAKVFSMDPTPTGGESIIFEYQSNAWVRTSPTSQLTLSRVLTDTDIPAFSSDLVIADLVWRYKEARGQPFASAFGAFEAKKKTVFAHDVGYQMVNMARRRGSAHFGGYLPESGYGVSGR